MAKGILDPDEQADYAKRILRLAPDYQLPEGYVWARRHLDYGPCFLPQYGNAEVIAGGIVPLPADLVDESPVWERAEDPLPEGTSISDLKATLDAHLTERDQPAADAERAKADIAHILEVQATMQSPTQVGAVVTAEQIEDAQKAAEKALKAKKSADTDE